MRRSLVLRTRKSIDTVIDPASLAPVRIEGPIDTPEELGEAFRRIDEVRSRRSELRRQQLDQRITREKVNGELRAWPFGRRGVW